jgi:hypothetical protein
VFFVRENPKSQRLLRKTDFIKNDFIDFNDWRDNMAFSQRFLEEIKERNEIEEVIGQFVPLKRAGSNVVGLCPFHNEKTPSFTVFSGTKSFYCFGCGAGGDVVTFVMKLQNLDYPEAVEYLAKRARASPSRRTRTAKPISRRYGKTGLSPPQPKRQGLPRCFVLSAGGISKKILV